VPTAVEGDCSLKKQALVLPIIGLASVWLFAGSIREALTLSAYIVVFGTLLAVFAWISARK